MRMSLSKNNLLQELASAAGLSRAQAAKVLDSLAAIAYREAEQGFTLPGLCRLSVATKKACRRRNPKTGQVLMIGEHRVLRVTPLKKARDAVAPRPANLVVPVTDAAPVPAPPPAAGPPPAEAPAVRAPAASAATAEPAGEILFRCVHCRSVLAAAPSQVGTEGACPYCKGKIVVPARDESGALPAPAPAAPAPAPGAPPAGPRADDFITFVCQTCDQEIEAPVDLLGKDVNCPACGAVIHVAPAAERPPAPGIQKTRPAIDRSAMTIRIDLSALQDKTGGTPR